ncbi:MAG: hypothetical protein ACOC9J_01865 [Persicimonas sp.]
MATSDTFFDALRCPETGQTLRRLGDERLDELNNAIRNGELSNEAGESVERTLEGALVREDEDVAYPIRDGVPNLLMGDRITL